MEKIIHSHTPEGDLWRYKTAEDTLLEELDNYCDKCKSHIGDGHDCDNCSFCGTDK